MLTTYLPLQTHHFLRGPVFSFHTSKAEATLALATFEEICLELGIKLKLAKKVKPTQRITLVGWIFDSVNRSISLPTVKRRKIIKVIRELLTEKSLSLLQLQTLGGNLNHASVVIPGSSLRLQWCGRATSMANAYGRYFLSSYDKHQLYWWISKLCDVSCMTTISNPTLRPVINIWSDRLAVLSLLFCHQTPPTSGAVPSPPTDFGHPMFFRPSGLDALSLQKS